MARPRRGSIEAASYQDHQYPPSRLRLPPDSPPRTPPTETLVQGLRFEELTFEDFERLCVRLVEQGGDIETVRVYGTRGQDQQGIDLYARRREGGEYWVYQCKRVRRFSGTDIRKAVTHFLEGANQKRKPKGKGAVAPSEQAWRWSDRASRLVLCVATSLIGTEESQEIERQRQRLQQAGKALEVWDAEALNLRLRGLPVLVHDFFGRGWVRAFCGEAALTGLERRLDAAQVVELRRGLRDFYRALFVLHDPGLVEGTDAARPPIPLAKRFVLPEIVERIRQGGSAEDPEPLTAPTPSEPPRHDPVGVPLARGNARPRPGSGGFDRRQEIQGFLAANPRNADVILGEPGSGKSSLLRFIALDLLEDEPRLATLAQRWGDRLPVWVPFPLWTRLLSDTQQHATSLGDLLRHHLHSNQQAHLWPLVASALDDDRLLLLVDGLDEYESVPAGNLALQRLGVLLEQGRARAVLVSRPAGYSRLQVSSNWRSCTLAPLSTAQQRELASRWLTHLWSGQGVAEEALEAKVRRFSGALVGEIGEVGQLREMAGVPLLFSLILWVRLTHGTVPTSRFKVYAQFITHLIQKHPNLRRAAAEANPQPPPFDLEQLTAAFEALAYEMQAAGGSGLIERSEARGRLVRLMTDPDGLFGLTTPEAIRKSSELLEVGEASLGLLANRSQTELGFLHRAFQEYLCAAFVSRLPFDEQLGMVRARCGDPQWREVLLSLLHRSERADEPTRLVTALREEGRKDHQCIAVQTILAEAAFGDFRLPAATAKQLAAEALEAVEADLPRAHREHLLRIVLGGRQSSRVGGLVRQRLAGWFPQRWGDDFYLFNAMGNWPPEPETVEALMRGLCAEEFEAQLGAATSLARLMPGDPQTQRRLVRLAQTAPRPEVRAAALEALMQGWPSCAELSDLALRFIASPSQVMQLYGIKHRVRTGTHDQSLLNLLLRLASRHRGLGYGHRTAMTALLVEGWPGHPGLKEAALRGCGPYTHQDSDPDFPVMEEEVAYGVLIAGFKGDPDAAAALVLELQSDHPFSGTERWNLWEDLQKHWRGSPALAAALEQLLRASGDQKELRDLERALAARFVGTDAAKRLLLSDLEAADGFDNPTLRALQEGWGITDPEVKKTLGSLVEQGKDEGIAHLLPDIMDDPIKVRARLLELLAGDERAFYRAMIGLEKLGAIADDAEAYALIKARILSKKDSWDDRYFHFAGWFAANDEVYPICLDLLESGLLYPGSFARAFGHKPEARELVRRHANPLPTFLRRLTGEHFARSSAVSEAELGLLGEYQHERDPDTRSLAATGYYAALRAQGRLGEEHLGRLRGELRAVGPFHDTARSAALCGVLAARRFDLLAEPDRDGKALRFTLGDGSRENMAAAAALLENWADVLAHLGASFHERMGTDEWHLFRRLTPLAAGHPAASQSLLDRLDQKGDLGSEVVWLEFLALARPADPRILSGLLGGLCGDGGSRWHPVNDWRLAALAAEHFAGDPQVHDRLAQSLVNNPFREHVLYALCQGWPDSPAVRPAAQRLLGGEVSWKLYLALRARLSSDDLVVEAVTQYIQAMAGSPTGLEAGVSDPVIRRLARDGDPGRMGGLAAVVRARLGSAEATASEKLSLAQLLRAANCAAEDLRRWAAKELADLDASGGFEGVGVDIVGQEVRGIRALLEEIVL